MVIQIFMALEADRVLLFLELALPKGGGFEEPDSCQFK
jgi:hypothetical protein